MARLPSSRVLLAMAAQFTWIACAVCQAVEDGGNAVSAENRPSSTGTAAADDALNLDKLIVIRRRADSPELGLPRNWQGNASLPIEGFADEIAVLSPVGPEGTFHTLFRPPTGRFVGDVDLNFDADRLLFSMPDDRGRWQVFEIRIDGTGLRQLTGEHPDVDSYDACYLPDGRIVFTSTAPFAGVPCVYGHSHVANLYLMDADGKNIRQLCFDQEHNWCPTVTADGRVLYSRWEYTDTPHSNTRILFQMNPDGTEQKAIYGSNSYWPNSFFYTRPIPGHPTKLVAVIGGHHDHPRMGELVVFDPGLGQREADGAVQRIPGRGKNVEPIIRDGLTLDSWPKFLHPYPLSEEQFLVACKPSGDAAWGIYLVDVFDNMRLIKESAGEALLEPIPLRPTRRPPVIADKVDLADKEATVFISDIYTGEGLRGMPRGTVKSLRIFTYHYAYRNMGGLLGVIGMDGPWDIKRVLGTVPVQPDGSAKFRIPANTPVSLQPLDAEGKAVQLMRSWMTAMPGEKVSCIGCHASEKEAPPRQLAMAHGEEPSPITPWYGPTRGFSFPREVQPVLDRYCIGCHNGESSSGTFSLRGDVKISDWSSVTPGNGGPHAGKFSVGYAELHRFVRRPGIESDYHVLEPMEYHADTTHLVQMLRKGHHGVDLDAESWDRLITWIDLNCPYHGTWGEEIDNPGSQRARRRELLKQYAGIEDDPEVVLNAAAATAVASPQSALARTSAVADPDADRRDPGPAEADNWPFDAAEAVKRQTAAGPSTERLIDLGGGMTLRLVLIPAGEFLMGSSSGELDEKPTARVRIEHPFWMGATEVTNEQYLRFDPRHDSRVESKNAYQFGIHGYPVNQPQQPVVRVTWEEARAFCHWISEETGMSFSLPSEAQWEWACRAGSHSPMWYGNVDDDFSQKANLADAKLTEFASDPYTVDTPLKDPSKYDDWIPKQGRFNDGAVLSVAVGRYQPNVWGLHDMHGNVAEWTSSVYRAYPFRDGDPQAEEFRTARRTVRGGSWRDVPQRGTSSFRLGYMPYQRVFNVGFRVVAELSAGEPQPRRVATR